MLRWLLFVLSLASATLGLLTIFKAPDRLEWKLALLAGEFGHWVALLPLVLFIAAWLLRAGHATLTSATLLAAGAAMALLLKPSLQAWRIGAGLPDTLARAFGPAGAPARSAFSFGRLFTKGPAAVPSETMEFAPSLALDFYRAVDAKGPAPCVIVVHGGGWDSGERGQIAQFNYWLARQGCAVADISYRLAPKAVWPAQRDDILAAMNFVKANAGKLGVDATRFVLFGRSAGGQMVEATAYFAHDPTIRGVVALYAPADMHFAFAYARDDDALKSPVLLRQFLGGTPDIAREAYDSASGIRLIDKNSTPTLLIHGQLDSLVWHRQSERLTQKLELAGVPHAFVSLPWATHALEFNLTGPSGQLTSYALEWFLAAVTK